jgi:hypothetical protein
MSYRNKSSKLLLLITDYAYQHLPGERQEGAARCLMAESIPNVDNL